MCCQSADGRHTGRGVRTTQLQLMGAVAGRSNGDSHSLENDSSNSGVRTDPGDVLLGS
jgi:hypothetical protein